MGNKTSIEKINFEDMQNYIKNNNVIIINTLSVHNQYCLIKNTIKSNEEEELINKKMKTEINNKIIIYGKNCNDETVYKKYKQLVMLGFNNISLYLGGLFQWLCLQDIYGKENFETDGNELDILKYK